MTGPRLIDHFEILRELGKGGMGKVFLARDTVLGRQVAVKLVSVEEAESEEERRQRAIFVERLEREAKIAAALDHPGIVTIYSVGWYCDQPYVVMQFVDGPTLDSLLRAGGPFDREETKRILKEVADALDHAHEMGVIHRDIKPPNIMLGRGGMVKICDFGIAKSAMLPRKASSMLMGTPYYMAPEQLTYKPVDRRADQWALAVVAYRMLTGSLPFQAEDISELAAQIVNSPLPSPQAFDSTLPTRVTEVLEKALSKEPAGRYATCSEFAADLAKALEAPVAKPAQVVANAVGVRTPAPAAPPTIEVGAGEMTAARKCYAEGKYEQALPLFCRAAEAGNAEAAAYVGRMYETGLGSLPKNDTQAVSWYRKAAEAGDAEGMNNLGAMYAKGRGGLPKDDWQAAHWYRKAGEAGHARAMANLGLMYFEGRGGLHKDPIQAVSWFRKAADTGDALGMAYLGFLYESGLGGLPRNEEQAVNWFRKAAGLGNTRAVEALKRLGR
jgi:TPR repeat protein/predicted Ser/Thr protein kinase